MPRACGRRQRPDAGAAAGAARQRGPRTATVQLAQADGSVVTREVQVGVSNRVHAEILSGLAEGDRVVAGRSSPSAQEARRIAMPPAAPPGGGFGPPGGFPGGFPGGR